MLHCWAHCSFQIIIKKKHMNIFHNELSTRQGVKEWDLKKNVNNDLVVLAVPPKLLPSSRTVWTVLTDTGFEFWMVLCGAGSWTQWSLGVLSSWGYSAILWFCAKPLRHKSPVLHYSTYKRLQKSSLKLPSHNQWPLFLVTEEEKRTLTHLFNFSWSSCKRLSDFSSSSE